MVPALHRTHARAPTAEEWDEFVLSPDGAVLRFSSQEWESFVEAVTRGRFDGI
ncbi:DUF397 domain-containing protein [Nonomuraea dietziae]|uniref:DUF397 domain-containing protein n=1 Tax=Nonomuraea dietziae TaxID=65515 RepID=UPI0031D08F6F